MTKKSIREYYKNDNILTISVTIVLEGMDMSESKGKKKIYAIAAAATAVVAVIVLAVVLILRAGGQESYRSIRIVELDGGVTIERESVGNLEASVNMNLTSGDRISTSADSYVVLKLDDDKYMMLGEQGAIQVVAAGDAANSRTEIHLESGSVLNEIQNPLSQDSSYEIITPNATMSVRGTVFETRNNIENGNIEVLVYEGNVAVALGGLEPVLYGPGEYTVFTSGDTPQFLEERGAITEEQMNSQMLQRLQQINESGRTLDFGEVDLEELVRRENSGQSSQVADNSQIQETEEPTAEPESPTPDAETPEPTVSASPAPTATITPKPSPTVEPTPEATPAPTEPPKPAPTVTPMATVVFYLPPIAESTNQVAIIGDAYPAPYSTQQVTVGSRVQGPEDPTATGSAGALTFMGWYKQSGELWDPDTPLAPGTLNLYPVWKDGDKCYYPVFLYAPEADNYYRCYCVREDSYLFECLSVSGNSYAGYTQNGAPKRNGHMLMAWEQTGNGNTLWGTFNGQVKGITSLKAVWLKEQESSSLVLFSKNGDLVGFYYLNAGEKVYLPDSVKSMAGDMDWRLEGETGESYSDVTIEDGTRFYIFQAVPKTPQ